MKLPDNEPRARLTIGGEEHTMHRYNSAIFLHLGKLSVYDHIFVQYEEEVAEDSQSNVGAYIFRHNESFAELMNFMAENQFTGHVNLTEVAECDRDAFDRAINKELDDLGDSFPENWDIPPQT